MHINQLSEKVIGYAIEVHRHLGPGLLESAYEACLCKELRYAGIEFERQVILPINYKGEELEVGYRLDILVENEIIVELKAVEKLVPIHEAQLLSYLKLSDLYLWLLNKLQCNVAEKRNCSPRQWRPATLTRLSVSPW